MPAGNYKMLLEEIREDTNTEKDILCSQTDRLNIGKTAVLPRATYRLNSTPIKIGMAFSCVWQKQKNPS